MELALAILYPGATSANKLGVHTYIHTYIYLISRFEIRNCTADVDLLLLSLDARTKIYKTII